MLWNSRWGNKSLKTESNLTLISVTTQFIIDNLSDLTDNVVTGFIFTISWLENMTYLIKESGLGQRSTITADS